jgi:hypothetical protein
MQDEAAAASHVDETLIISNGNSNSNSPLQRDGPRPGT